MLKSLDRKRDETLLAIALGWPAPVAELFERRHGTSAPSVQNRWWLRAKPMLAVRPRILGAVLALAASHAGAAQAATYSIVGTGGTLHVHTAPALSAPIVGNLRDGTQIDVVCQTRGDRAVGSTMWDKIDQPTSGYIADWYTSTPVVNNPSPGLPACGSPASQTTPPPNGVVGKLENGQSARCLDADAATLGSPGTRVQLWNCWGGSNQNWVFKPDGTIRSAQSGQCLDADMGTIRTDGTIVHLWPCNGESNQRWTIGGGGVIRNQHSGRCLDADMGTIGTDATTVQLWDCNGGHNQNWTRFAANSRVPDLCYTYTSGFQSTLKISFGLHATFCYNGSSVSVRDVKPWCVNTNTSGTCSLAANLSTDSDNVTQDFEISVPFLLPPRLKLSSFTVYYTPYSSISVSRHGRVRMSSSLGAPTYGL